MGTIRTSADMSRRSALVGCASRGQQLLCCEGARHRRDTEEIPGPVAMTEGGIGAAASVAALSAAPWTDVCMGRRCDEEWLELDFLMVIVRKLILEEVLH